MQYLPSIKAFPAYHLSVSIPAVIVRSRAKMKKSAFLLVFLLVASSFVDDATADGSGFCDSKCGVRCSKAGMQDRCLKYCGICCRQCNCVPSGTYGNKHECPCYNNLKNSKGKSKCP